MEVKKSKKSKIKKQMATGEIRGLK